MITDNGSRSRSQSQRLPLTILNGLLIPLLLKVVLKTLEPRRTLRLLFLRSPLHQSSLTQLLQNSLAVITMRSLLSLISFGEDSCIAARGICGSWRPLVGPEGGALGVRLVVR